MRPLLIVDFEATCWGPDAFAPEPHPGCRYVGEVIEFGCALLDDRGRAIERTWQQHVQPLHHPRLTTFCTELTGITQAQIDVAPRFPDALDAFRDTFGIRGGAAPRFASWGNYDRNILTDDCRKHDLTYPFDEGNHINLKAEAKSTFGWRKRMGVARALQALDMTFEGRPHCGLDDARNIARIAMRMLVSGWRPPTPQRTG